MLPVQDFQILGRRLRELGLTSPREYYGSKHWRLVASKNKRKRAECTICDIKKPLELHHLTYSRLGCEGAPDLVWTCRDCYELIHAYANEHKMSIHNATNSIRAKWKSVS